MNLGGIIHIGRRYLRQHRGKTALLVAAITCSLFLPLAIMLTVQQAETHLRSRSASTPLLLGITGSPLELVFNGLYFSEPGLEPITAGEARRPAEDGLADVIPIHARFEARGFPIVGTSVEYFGFRGLRVAQGQRFLRLGDCVLGATVARELDLGPGDTIRSTPAQAFDLAGTYPLEMRIAGVLSPSGTVDDRAVFVDMPTTWIIEGIAHGHIEDVAEDEVLSREGDATILNAKVTQFQRVTADNIASFHLHGDPETFPVTSAIVIPRDVPGSSAGTSETILLGRYVGRRSTSQLIQPDAVMEQLFATVFQVRNLVVTALAAVGIMAAGIAGLVFVLSNRLRAREFESLANLGADRSAVALLIGFEAIFVLGLSLVLTAILVTALALAMPTLIPLVTR
ncbi:MAG: ABC transporter permease [Phycisphaerales bacterium]